MCVPETCEMKKIGGDLDTFQKVGKKWESGEVGPTGGGQNRSINPLHLNVHKTKGHFKTLHVHFLFNLPTTAHCDLSAFA